MSAKSVAAKLQIRSGTTLWSSDPARVALVEPLPEGVRVVGAPGEAAGALVNRTDVNRDSLARILFQHRLRPVSQIAVDDIWSALRFRPLKPDESFNPHTYFIAA